MSTIATPASPKVRSLKPMETEFEGELLFGIGGQLWRIVIWFREPDMSSAEVVNQFRVLRAHIARPNHLRPIDVGIVEHPFVKDEIVIRAVADDHQMLAGSIFKL